MKTSRENPSSYTLALSNDRNIMGAVIRLCCVLGYAACLILSRFTSGERGIIPAVIAIFALCVVAIVGSYFALAGALHIKAVNAGSTLNFDWLTNKVVHSEEKGSGLISVNLPGILEFSGAAVLALGLYTFSSPIWALGALAFLVVYFGTTCANVFLDIAFYNPRNRRYWILEALRSTAGPLAACVTFALTAWAFPAGERVAVAALCGALLSLGPRIRQTDQIMVGAEELSRRRELLGRTTVLAALHDELGNALTALNRQTHPLRKSHPGLFDAVRNVEGAYREILMLDHTYESTLDWPGVLLGRLQALDGRFGCQTVFEQPDGTISSADRATARIVIDDLARNAAEAGALAIHVILRRDAQSWQVDVSDNGPAIDPTRWMRSAGGIARLANVLSSLDGSITRTDNPKVISARWTARPEPQKEPNSED